MGMFHWVSLCSNTLNSKSLHTLYFFHFYSFTETSKEKKTKVDPKLVFPLKLWLLSWLPRERKRWNSKTGLPQSDDKEDWVQLGERKQPGSPEEVPHPVYAQFFQSAFPLSWGLEQAWPSAVSTDNHFTEKVNVILVIKIGPLVYT